MKKLYAFIFVLSFGIFCFWQNASLQKAFSSCPPGEIDIGSGVCAKPAACADPTPTPTPIPTPTSRPTPIVVGCNANCDNAHICSAGLICSASQGNRCRLASYVSSTNCSPPPTPTPTIPPPPTPTPTPPSCVFQIQRGNGNESGFTGNYSGIGNFLDNVVLNNPVVTSRNNDRYTGPRMGEVDADGSSYISDLESIGITGNRLGAWNYMVSQMGVYSDSPIWNAFFDSSGNMTSSNINVCGWIETVSLVSLIFSKKPEEIYASSFALIPSKDLNKWYQWKASANRPLLVFDPKHTGQITSASQLFGNYTFGKSWSNGYEALATLDTNHDNKVSNSELKDLALWFDNNQDGISDKYEVKKLSEVGITALFFEPSSSDIETRDIKANIGYEREVCVTESLLTKTCHKEIGQSVDWYGAGPFETKEEAILGKKYLFGMGFSNIQKQFLR